MDPRDPRIDPVEPTLSAQTPSLLAGSALLPLILAAAIILILILMYLPNTTSTRVGGTTNAGPSVETVNPSPSPSTSPPVPTPTPTTEPRPTQAPIQ
jgi:hypothetical protein